MILLPLCFIWTNLACIMMIGTMCEVLHMLYKGGITCDYDLLEIVGHVG